MPLPPTHPHANKYRLLDAIRLQELADDIAENGQLDPVVFSSGPASEGLLIDGRNRWLACEFADVVPEIDTIAFATEEDIIAFVEGKNDHRRHLTPEEQEAKRQERIARVAELREEGKSLRMIAKETGISKRQVEKDLQVATGSHLTTPATITGTDGKAYAAHRPASSPAGEHRAPRLLISNSIERAERSGPGLYDAAIQQREERINGTDTTNRQHRERIFKVDILGGNLDELSTGEKNVLPRCDQPSDPEYTPGQTQDLANDARRVSAQVRSAQQPVTLPPTDLPPLVDQKKGAHVGNATGDPEWYTPAPYIEAARAVLGIIDLDPASCETANQIVKAERYYTKEDDGPAMPWSGNVWMNPPYAAAPIARFAKKLREEFEGGAVSAAVVLVNNATETKWFADLIACASAVCFPSGRVHFWHPDKEDASPLQGQAILYLGPTPERFAEEFAVFGWVSTNIHQPKKGGA